MHSSGTLAVKIRTFPVSYTQLDVYKRQTVTTWVSTDEPHRVTGLHFGESYTLTEIRAADGYALANDITFRLIQKSDEDGNPLEECEVYYLTTKNILFWKWDDWKLLDDRCV